jgi:hypothetical protein
MIPSAPIKNENNPTFDHGKEFVALRSEILAQLKDERSLERYVLVTTGAIWVFLITHHITDWQPWTIPIALVLIASARAWSIMRHLGAMGKYIRTKLEPENGGWQHFLEEEQRSSFLRWFSDFGPWICLLIFSVVGLVLGPCLATLTR